MTKQFLIAATLLGFTTLPALASFAPIKYTATREEISQRCETLGKKGQGWGLGGDFGVYGCRNLANGNTVKCNANGQCTDYAGDFRWKNMRKYFDGVTTEQVNPRRV